VAKTIPFIPVVRLANVKVRRGLRTMGSIGFRDSHLTDAGHL